MSEDEAFAEMRAHRLSILRQAPNNWKIGELDNYCSIFGTTFSPPRGGGSHYKVTRPGKREILTIPSRRPIKPIYIKKLIAFLQD